MILITKLFNKTDNNMAQNFSYLQNINQISFYKIYLLEQKYTITATKDISKPYLLNS